MPIAILNACQSGKAGDGDHGSSLGARLLQAGAQNVLAMSYSVTVSAAEKMMPRLYEALFGGGPGGSAATLGEAVRQARLGLRNDRVRRANFEQSIDLEDWILPVHYQREDVRLVPRRMYLDEEEAWYARKGRVVPDPVTATGSFLGRDIDTLQIERRLDEHNVLLIHGGGGTGKTTLMRHLAAWWQRTGWIEAAHDFGYEERAWTLEQILQGLAAQIFDPATQRSLPSGRARPGGGHDAGGAGSDPRGGGPRDGVGCDEAAPEGVGGAFGGRGRRSGRR